MFKVMTVFGTRPEGIKMAPLIKALQAAPDIEAITCVTAQHREMLDQVLSAFDIRPDIDLNLMRPGQTPASLTTDGINAVMGAIAQYRPDIVLVHGDTSTTLAAALAAFYSQVKIGHVEAGLRTYNRYSPYPEEMNRQLTSRLADLHFAPTKANAAALAKENITENVFITGNTVIDALQYTVQKGYKFEYLPLNELSVSHKKVVLLTAHRRENLGEPMENIFRAVYKLAEANTDAVFVYPVHLNPAVQKPAEAIMGGHPRINLIPPVSVLDMHNLMSRCMLVMTDSGGLQEEAPSLGKPVVVLRTETERPEAVEAGTVVVSGTDTGNIFTITDQLLNDTSAYEKMARAVNPYGDGHASERILKELRK